MTLKHNSAPIVYVIFTNCCLSKNLEERYNKIKIAKAERDRSDRLSEAKKLIEKKLKQEEVIRLQNEKERRLKELEERKIKAEENRKLQEEEVKKSREIERENLKNMYERQSSTPPDQEK